MLQVARDVCQWHAPVLCQLQSVFYSVRLPSVPIRFEGPDAPHGPALLCCLFCCVLTVGHMDAVLRFCVGSWQAFPRAERNIRSPRAGGRKSGKMSSEMGSLPAVLETRGGGLTEEFTNAMPRTIHAMRRSGGATDGGETHEQG